VFAVSYTATWTASQHDQAAYQVGADIRMDPGRRAGSPPNWAIDRLLADTPGVMVWTPVSRDPISLARASRSAEVLGIDALTAAEVVAFRTDIADVSLQRLIAPLVAGRPQVNFIPLPFGPGERHLLRVTADVEATELTTEGEPGDPNLVRGWPGLSVAVVLRDATGALFRFTGESGPLGRENDLVVQIGTAGADSRAAFAYPLELVAIELSVDTPPGTVVSGGSVALRGVSAQIDGVWTPVPLHLDGGWRARASYFRGFQQPVDLSDDADGLVASVGGASLPALLPLDAAGRGMVMTLAPEILTAVTSGTVPLLLTDAGLDATGHGAGDDFTMRIAEGNRNVAIVGVVRGFPGTAAGQPVVIADLPTLALLQFERAGTVGEAEEWWLRVDGGQGASVALGLAQPPLLADAVMETDERASALSRDPVALGIIGALTIGSVAAALFAAIGFVISMAVSVRERLTEFALLRALGLSESQLMAWLALESAVLALISLAAGTAIGLAMAWVALPSITVTQDAKAPFPPVEVHIPWGSIAVLEFVGLAVLGLTLLAVTRLMRSSGIAARLRIGED
ncbi:MAG: FtsX-like permease family protein, partial [Chloroflexota bacterium]